MIQILSEIQGTTLDNDKVKAEWFKELGESRHLGCITHTTQYGNQHGMGLAVLEVWPRRGDIKGCVS